jgi:hypothetical protein
VRSEVRTTHSISGVFIFLLLGLFALFATLAVVLSAKAYRNSEERSEAHNEYRLLSSYVRSMVRAEDGPASFRVEKTEGVTTLTMEENYDGDRYLTRLYCSGGKLREWFSDAENPFVPEDGEPVCDAEDFYALIKDRLLSVGLKSRSGGWVNLSIALYSEQQAPETPGGV